MARTQKIQLFYKLTPKEIIPPPALDLARKEQWIEDQRKGVPSEWESKIVKVEYSIHDPEIADQMRFFNGTIVKYYAIQSKEIIIGMPDTETLRACREEILDGILGYDVRMAKMIQRKRASTTEFVEVQQWSNFINTVQEEIFDPSGYIFPDSKEFWKLVALYGYEKAEDISIGMLRESLKRKNETKN